MEHPLLFCCILLLCFIAVVTVDGDEIVCDQTYYVEVGTQATVSCQYDQSFLAVRWYFDSAEVTFLRIDGTSKSGSGIDNGEFDIGDDGSMIIKNVGLKHEGRYTISVLHQSVTVSKKEIMVYAMVTLNEVVITDCGSSSNDLCNTIPSKQRESTLLCVAEESRPPVEIEWKTNLQDEKIKSLPQDYNVEMDPSTMIYTSSSYLQYESNLFVLGYFTCHVNGVAAKDVRNASVLLRGRGEFLQHTEDIQYVEEGSLLQLQCPEHSFQYAILKLTDSSNTEKVIMTSHPSNEDSQCSQSSRCHVREDGLITIEKVSLKDEGLYECAFGNGVDTYNHAVNVIIVVSPSPPMTVIAGCEDTEECKINGPGFGILKCSLFGSKPPTRLFYTVPENLRSNVVIFNIRNDIVNSKTSGIFDSVLTAEYEITGCPNSVRIKCEAESEVHSGTKFTDVELTAEEFCNESSGSTMIVILTLLVVLILVAALVITFVIMKKRKNSSRKKLSPNTAEESERMIGPMSSDEHSRKQQNGEESEPLTKDNTGEEDDGKPPNAQDVKIEGNCAEESEKVRDNPQEGNETQMKRTKGENAVKGEIESQEEDNAQNNMSGEKSIITGEVKQQQEAETQLNVEKESNKEDVKPQREAKPQQIGSYGENAEEKANTNDEAKKLNGEEETDKEDVKPQRKAKPQQISSDREKAKEKAKTNEETKNLNGQEETDKVDVKPQREAEPQQTSSDREKAEEKAKTNEETKNLNGKEETDKEDVKPQREAKPQQISSDREETDKEDVKPLREAEPQQTSSDREKNAREESKTNKETKNLNGKEENDKEDVKPQPGAKSERIGSDVEKPATKEGQSQEDPKGKRKIKDEKQNIHDDGNNMKEKEVVNENKKKYLQRNESRERNYEVEDEFKKDTSDAEKNIYERVEDILQHFEQDAHRPVQIVFKYVDSSLAEGKSDTRIPYIYFLQICCRQYHKSTKKLKYLEIFGAILRKVMDEHDNQEREAHKKKIKSKILMQLEALQNKNQQEAESMSVTFLQVLLYSVERKRINHETFMDILNKEIELNTIHREDYYHAFEKCVQEKWLSSETFTDVLFQSLEKNLMTSEYFVNMIKSQRKTKQMSEGDFLIALKFVQTKNQISKIKFTYILFESVSDKLISRPMFLTTLEPLLATKQMSKDKLKSTIHEELKRTQPTGDLFVSTLHSLLEKEQIGAMMFVDSLKRSINEDLIQPQLVTNILYQSLQEKLIREEIFVSALLELLIKNKIGFISFIDLLEQSLKDGLLSAKRFENQFKTHLRQGEWNNVDWIRLLVRLSSENIIEDNLKLELLKLVTEKYEMSEQDLKKVLQSNKMKPEERKKFLEGF